MARKLLVYDTVNRRFVHALKYGSTILFKFKVRYKDVKINVRENEGQSIMDNPEKRVPMGPQDTGRRQKTKNKKTRKKHNTTQKTKTTRNSKMLDITMHKHAQKHNKTNRTLRLSYIKLLQNK